MENKKTKIISIASMIALTLTLITATFAYFMAQIGEEKSTDVNITDNNSYNIYTYTTNSYVLSAINNLEVTSTTKDSMTITLTATKKQDDRELSDVSQVGCDEKWIKGLRLEEQPLDINKNGYSVGTLKDYINNLKENMKNR
jgi:hypothetical protein